MIDFKPLPRRTALILFDMINDMLLPGAPFDSPQAREQLVPRLKRLLAACRSKGMLIIFACHSHRPDGSDLGLLREIYPVLREGRACVAGTTGVEVYKELAPQPGEIIIAKPRYDAFYATDLELILRQRGIDTLVITGISTGVGVETTVRGAMVRDFRVILPSDGTMNKDLPDRGWGTVSQEEIMKVVLTLLAHAVCRVCTIDEVIAELS